MGSYLFSFHSITTLMRPPMFSLHIITTRQDESRSYPSHSMDGCDGMLSVGARGPPGDGSGALARSLSGYWDQGPEIESDLCEYFKTLEQLTQVEKDIACHSQPRVLPKLVDEDLLDYTKSRE